MKKEILYIFTLLLLVGCSEPFSNVTLEDEDIWVSISYDRGAKVDQINVLLEKDLFNQITQGNIEKGWLEFNEGYWERNGTLMPISEAGKQWGYGDRCIIRVESIQRIIPLSEETIEKLNNENNNIEQDKD